MVKRKNCCKNAETGEGEEDETANNEQLSQGIGHANRKRKWTAWKPTEGKGIKTYF